MSTRRLSPIPIALALVSVAPLGSPAEPPTLIDNDVVRIALDHDPGEICALTYKHGSSQELLDPHRASGIGRLHGLGEDPGASEYGSSLIAYEVQPEHASFAYHNPLYGQKSLDISWSAVDGVHIDITYVFDGADGGRREEAHWKPGGTHDNDDYITFVGATGTTGTFPVSFTRPGALIWEGEGYGSILWDADYDEHIGHRTEYYLMMGAANSGSIDGPWHSMEQPGTYVLHIAVTNSAACQIWFDSFGYEGPYAVQQATWSSLKTLYR